MTIFINPFIIFGISSDLNLYKMLSKGDKDKNINTLPLNVMK